MTWKELATLISEMPDHLQDDPVVLVANYHGPDRRVINVEAVRASDDVWSGISVGNECVVERGHWMLTDIEEDVGAGPR